MQTSGNSRREKAKLCLEWLAASSLLSSPGYAGDPVRRGFSAQALLSLEYWIARSSRAKTSREWGV